MIHDIVCSKCHKSNNNLDDDWTLCTCGYDLRDEMAIQPYRQLAVVEKENKPTCGFLHPQKCSLSKLHICSVPNWLDTLFLAKLGTLWRCGTCKKVWELVPPSDSRTGNVTFSDWVYASETAWLAAGGEK